MMLTTTPVIVTVLWLGLVGGLPACLPTCLWVSHCLRPPQQTTVQWPYWKPGELSSRRANVLMRESIMLEEAREQVLIHNVSDANKKNNSMEFPSEENIMLRNYCFSPLVS